MSDFNLGTVTAYGYAKDKGYTGTEDEYAELMASYADVAEQAAESAEQAAASATTATTKASEASDSASAASASKTAAQNAQSSAESAATTATTKASEASNSASTATTKAGEATTAAGTATTAATSAAGSATTATTKAGEAATSATTAAEAAQRAEDAAATLVIDDTLTHAGQAADAKKTGDEIGDLKDGLSDMDDRVSALEQGSTGGGLTDDIKQALLQIAEKVAYIDEDGQDYYDALEDALYPPADLVSISAVYTQSGTVYDTDSLDSLKVDLVVTAHMSDSTTRTVTAYTLSGTLAEGTSTVTVSYGGKTTTFTVIVTANTVITGYTSVGTPSISGNEFTPSVNGYIKTTEVFSPGDSSWAIRFKIARSDSPANTYENLYRAVDASNNAKRATFIQARETGHNVYASSNDSANDIMSGQSFTINNGAVKYIEISFDGSQTYTVKTSTDGETWTTELTQTSSSKIYSGDYIAFGGPNSGTVPYDGIIYMDTIKIYIDGDLWWQATA